MEAPRIIVIGASAGGFEAIQTLVALLPSSLPASIFIVWHMSAEIKGILPHVLNKLETLPAANAIDGERILPGRIYVAAPDFHLIIEEGIVRTTRGPKENRFRPAVDPLFRSAAYAYGPSVIGIVLSGALDDGTSGLWEIKSRGGIAIVQDPGDAAVSSMPQSAMNQVAVDYAIPVADMPALLTALCSKPISSFNNHTTAMESNRQIAREIRIAKGELQDTDGIGLLGTPTVFTCPECHGVLGALYDGNNTRYRCHTGHAYSPDSLLAAITNSIEESLWGTARAVEEAVMLLNRMGDYHAEANTPRVAAKYFKKAKDAGERLNALKMVITTNELLSNDRIINEDDND